MHKLKDIILNYFDNMSYHDKSEMIDKIFNEKGDADNKDLLCEILELDIHHAVQDLLLLYKNDK